MTVDTPFVHIARPPRPAGRRQPAAARWAADSGSLAPGERVAEFEARFAETVGAKHAVAVASGALALWVALRAALRGVKPGDEVISAPFSLVASANVVLYAGARPVFADVDPDTHTLDPESVRAAITPRTRAIMPVHLYGGVADMDALMTIAREHGLAVIEDACQAHGAALRGKRAGSFGSGGFSFHSAQNTTTPEGGILTTDDDRVAEQARLLRGDSRPQNAVTFGMTEAQAALRLAQLNHVETWLERRIANAAHLSAQLAGVRTPVVRPGSRHVFHQYAIRVPAARRAEFVRRLTRQGIDTATLRESPRPVHLRPIYRKLGYAGHLPVAEQVAREVVSLPVHPALDQADLARIVDAVRAALEP